MILIELTAAVDAAGTTQTFYVSDAHFATAPTDTPPNTAFRQFVLDPGRIGVNAFGYGKTGGGTKLETGEIVLANANGQLNAWLDYSFDGRPVTIRSGDGGAYPADFPVVFKGTVEGVDMPARELRLRLRDKQFIFAQPLLTTLYAGTNVLPDGIEGTAGDIKGKVKPRAYGKCRNVAAVLVNTSKGVFQVSDRAVQDIPAVMDGGGPITKGANHATSALLLAASPAGATYDTCFAEGLFRLGGAGPVGQVTADVTQGATSANRTAAQIIRQIAIDGGLTAGEVSAADVAALDALNSAEVGIWVNGMETAQTAMDMIAGSIGAWFGFDGAGILRMARLSAPTGSPVATLTDSQVGVGIARRPARDNGVPIWRAVVRHSKNWTVQTSGLVGSASAATRAYLAEEFRSAKAEDAAVKVKWLLAEELAVDTLLDAESAADTEAARLLGLHKVRRDIFEVPIHISILTRYDINMMDVVALHMSSFGLEAGKLFRVIGRRIELKNSRAFLTLWG